MYNENKKNILNSINKGEVSPEEGLRRYMEALRHSKKLDSVYYQYDWKRTDIDKKLSEQMLNNKRILIFDHNTHLFKYLENRLKNLGCTITLVKSGEVYENLDEQTYTIRKEQEADYNQLFSTLKAANKMPDTIIHLWSEIFIDDPESLRDRLDSSIFSVFYIIKALMLQKTEKKIQFLYTYNQYNNEEQPHNDAVSGFLKTVSMENSNFICSTLKLDSSIKTGDVIIEEISNLNSGVTEVKYEGSRRMVKVLSPLIPSPKNQPTSVIKDGGVYLITGGLGGLGRIFAKHLANHANIKLILTGRSKIDIDIETSLKEIKALGANITYIQADISDHQQTKRLISQIKDQYNKIDGVIHSAGIIKDAFILRKTQQEMEAVFAPKVYGIMNLAHALRNEKLEFFIVFSSLSGITGNIGQSDYAYANCFMDSYVNLIDMSCQFNRVMAINWPYWKDGGMAVDDSAEERMLKDFGLIPMSTEHGLNAFDDALTLMDISQLMVFEGDKDNISNALNRMNQKEYTDDANEGIDDVHLKDIKKKTEYYLKEMLSKEIQLQIDRIKVDEVFENYGIDSVMIMNFNKYLEKDFKGLPKTLLFEYQNINELVDYLMSYQLTQLTHLFGASKKENEKSKPLAVRNKAATNKYETNSNQINTIKKSRRFDTTRFLIDDAKSYEDKVPIGDIAIIGISGKYPMADTLEDFWDNLKIGKDCITEIPSDRWDYRGQFDPDKTKKGKSYSKWGSFINGADQFDPLFFNISPKEAELMDPQERLFLQTAWHTLEDGGYTRKSISDKKVGVFVGVMYGYYQFYGAEESIKGNVIALNSSYATIANRVSYILNLTGPSMAVDTMCSSSLTSIHLACDSLRLGQSDIAIAGGVNLTIHPNKYILLSQGNFASSDGRCRSFGEGGDGYVPGEGVGAVLLKPLIQAEADGDKIYGVIKGSSLNHGGKTNGYSVPNPNAQGELIKEALKNSGVNPRTISYVEAHGTGTSLGDPIEISGLVKAYSSYTNDKQYCPIGSAKSVIGHLESAAGVAAVTKVLLQMKNKMLVPSIHSEVLNPNINFKETPFYVQQTLEEWKRPEVEGGVYPRIAAISSFGAGGSNAHIIIEEYETKNEDYASKGENVPCVFTLSAKNAEQLNQYASDMVDYLNKRLMPNNDERLEYSKQLSVIQNKLQQDLLKEAALSIDVNAADMDINENIIEYGFDHVKLAGLTSQINDKFRLTLSTHVFYEYQTIKAFSDYLLKNFYEGLFTYYSEDQVIKKNAEQSQKIKLEDITYTLQIGREGMEERLAMVVTTLEELRSNLTAYTEGKTNIKELFYGNIRKHDDLSHLILDELEGIDLINKLTDEAEPSKLARLWVRGVAINWDRLYVNRNAKKVSLPTYPFAKEKYWIPEADASQLSSEKINGTVKLHPLIDRNTSDFNEQKYTSQFSINQFFLKDHIVLNRNIMPGVVYIEMARAAGELAGHLSVNHIKNLMWIKPIIIDGPDKEVNICLHPNATDVSFEVITETKDGEKVSNCTGEFSYVNRQDEKPEAYINLSSIEEKCSNKLEKKELYELCSKNGLDYGTDFQVVSKLIFSEGEALGKLELPDTLINDFDQFVLHPSIMDGAFQSITGLLQSKDVNRPFLPFALEEVEIFGSTAMHCFVYIKEISKQENANLRKYDLKITDNEGKILIGIKGLTLKALALAEKLSPSTMYLKNQWIKSEVLHNWDEKELIRDLIIFDTDDDLSRQFKPFPGRVVLIKQGRSFKRIENDQYEIRPNHKEDYEELVNELKTQDFNLGHIIYAWSKVSANAPNALLQNQLKYSIYPIFNLSVTLTSMKIKQKINVLYLYEAKDSTPYDMAIGAFAKTVLLENPYIHIKAIGVEHNQQTITDTILTELYQDKAPEVQYLGKERYVRKLEHFVEEDFKTTADRFKENGVYIITGGLGGLGFLVAGYITHVVKGQVVLTGRSELDSNKETKIKELSASGAQVLYINGDISKRKDVKNIINQTKEAFGTINGIIHCAGINRDALLYRKTAEDMKAVLAAKVFGTRWLDKETENESLDLFITFSSTTSVLGNIGQGDYAYANGFMDSYCEMRERLRKEGKRTGKTLAINWPLWEEGGMTMDESSKKWMEERYGLIPLMTEEGIKALERSLNLSASQVVILYGEQEKIQKMIGAIDQAENEIDKNENAENIKPVKSEINIQDNGLNEENFDSLKENTQRYLKEILSKETKVPINKIDPKKAFEEYGIDSVMIVNLNRELEREFGELSKTLLFEYQSIGELAVYFIEHHYEQLIDKLGLKSPIKSVNTYTEVESETTFEQQMPLNRVRFVQQRLFQTTQEDIEDSSSEDIAVIGLSGKYPMADNIEAYWDNLKNGRDCISEIPPERWDYHEYFDPDKDRQGKSYSKWGGFITDVDKFDPLFFNISPKEAELMDPQERLFLETAWQTIEDAGYTRDDLSQCKVGVYVGVMYGHYQLYGAEESLLGNVIALSSSFASIANRISYYLNLCGPSMAVDTMCSSSLTSIHLACESIRRGESELAIAGGVNVSIHPNKYIALSQGRFVSSDGKCRSFGEGGDGYVPGEGVGAVLLKPLKKAIKDKDNIYAVIKGSSVNHGGKTNGYTVPNPIAQKNVISEAIHKSGIDPETISCIEAHGTGTSLGDPIEITGLVKAFGEFTGEKRYCAIGSAKSNIGHLESAAGIAGITKVLLQLKHKQLVPSLHSEVLNSNIKFQETPFKLQHTLEEWKCPQINNIKHPRRAGISSFGAGGSNAHIILEEFNLTKEAPMTNEQELIILSAKSKEGLKKYARNVLEAIDHKKVIHKPAGKIKSKSELESEIITLISELLSMSKSEISLNDTFDELGLDPVLLNHLAGGLSKVLGFEITIEQLLQYDTLQTLIEKVATKEQDNKETETSKNINLKEMAYTLQVGREAMNERLAIIVSGIDELVEKLTAFLEDKIDTNGLFIGHIMDSNIGSLLSDAEAFISTMVKSKELDKLAQLWVSGVDINWNILYSEHTLRRISLPTYPFAKERYWVPRANKIGDREGFKLSRLHPLIEANTSNLREQRFTTTFTGDEYYFADHVISGKKMFPGAAYIEMAYAAGEIAGEGKVTKIKNIIWTRPITITDQSKKVSISLYPNDKTVQYEIATLEADNKNIHSQGELELSYQQQDYLYEEKLNIERIKSGCRYISGNACYRYFKEKGFDYGTNFKTIQDIYSKDNEALAYIKLPDTLLRDFSKYTLHPTLLDGALQAVMGVNYYSGEDEGANFVPFAIDEIEVLGHLKTECLVHVVLEDTSKSVKKYSIRIADTDGVTLVTIKNLTLRALETSDKNENTMLYFSDEWVKTSVPGLNGSLNFGNLLVLSNEEAIKEKLDPLIKGSVILVKTGKNFKALEQPNIYEISPQDAGSYHQLFKCLKEEGLLPQGILHLWNASQSETNATLEKQLDMSAYSVLHLTQGLMAQRPSEKIKLVYGYQSLEAGQAHNEGISGFLKTLTIENPNFSCKSVEIVSPTDDQGIHLALKELQLTDGVEVRYIHNERFVKQSKKISVKNNKDQIENIRHKGVYIITGGAGGLGLITATYLATYQAKLVLTGRSAYDMAKEKMIQELKELGAEVIYIQADVSKKEQVTMLIEETKKHYGKINGIIHSAGVLKDAFIIKKTKEDMEAVLAPKVYGTINLDEATQNENLDFFVVFSSAAGKLGNVGQCDYAYGNSFMDHYCKRREKLCKLGKRSGITRSLSWPLWKDGGMRVDAAIEKYMSQQMGLKPLDTESGILAFKDGFKIDAVSLLILYGDATKISDLVMPYDKKVPLETKGSTEGWDNQEEALFIKAEKFFKEILSHEIKLPVDRIQSTESFEKYGLDSVMIMSLNKTFEKHFGELSKTLLFECQCIEDLTNYFVNHHKDQLTGVLGGLKPPIKTYEVRSNEGRPTNFKPRFINVHNVETRKNTEIAIIGLSGRYPGADDLEEFWENLKDGKDCITEIPSDRWDYNLYYHPDKNKRGKCYSKWGGFLNDIDKFDPLFFNISPKEAEIMDPQERLFLETVWHTIEDAGYTKEALSKISVGVYVGVMNGHYQMYGVEESMKGNVISLNSSFSSIANRVSYCLNLNGPSIALDTMCSSSITAIHLACESINSGDSDMVIAGGVNLSIHPNKYIGLSQGKFVSTDGKCRSFGEGGDGYVPGEGVGALLLKPLDKAIEDRDYIYGVIKSSSLNHGGKTNGYTVPNPTAQANLIEKSIAKAGIDPRNISYVEAHGTGTELGDPIEISGLTKAYRKYTQDKQYCAIGSVKSNIGHLESAAGIAGITKILLQMKYKTLVPSIHSQVLNQNINFGLTPFYVQHGLQEWEQPEVNGKKIKRLAGISAFGAGGSNAHLIIEAFDMQTIDAYSKDHQPQLILLSANNGERLREYVINFIKYLEGCKETISLENMAYTLQVGREALEERLAIIATDTTELVHKLSQYINDRTNIEFLFSGSKKHIQSSLSKLITIQKGKKFIDELIQNRELELLAELWVSGVDLDWRLMYNAGLPQKLSLPTYPFAKERYWVPINNLENELILSDDQEAMLERTEQVSYLHEPTNRMIKKGSAEESLEVQTKRYFKEQISSIIKLSAERIDEDAPIEKYGIDSIVMMQLTNNLEVIFGQLPKTLFFEYHTVNEIAEYFLDMYKDALIRLFGIEDEDTWDVISNEGIITNNDFVANNEIITNDDMEVNDDYIRDLKAINPEEAARLLTTLDHISDEAVEQFMDSIEDIAAVQMNTEIRQDILTDYERKSITSEEVTNLLLDMDQLSDEEVTRLLTEIGKEKKYGN